MHPAAHIATAAQVLSQFYAADNQPIDALLHRTFKGKRFIGAKDKKAIASRVYGVVRHHYWLLWWAQHSTGASLYEGQADFALHLLVTYLTLHEKKSPGEVNNFFGTHEYALPPLHKQLRRLAEELWNHPKHGGWKNHKDMDAATKSNMAPWLFHKMQANVDELPCFTAKNLEEAPVDLRVNTAKANREKLLHALNQKYKWKAEKTPFSPCGIRLPERVALQTTSEFKDGLFEVQDEGSQLLAQLVNAQPGERIVDFCAGGGGKSLAMAPTMKNKGMLVLCDINSRRLENASKRLKRAGVHHAHKPIDLTKTDDERWLFKTLKHKANKVLVDAPCSGSGTWRRNPDLKIRLTAPQFKSILSDQANILKRAATLVKPGGLLVYATCSVIQEENESQVQAFLKDHPHFELQQANTVSPLPMCDIYFKALPHEHNMDGFFGAILKRKET